MSLAAKSWCGGVGALLFMPAVATAQIVPAGTAADRAESTVVVANPSYSAAGAGRLLFGTHYRALWTTPIRVPVLSLSRYAGGLTPTARGGSMQTKALHLAGADGREYVFRSIDKDPTQSLPPDLRETFAREIVRDLISAEHPAGAIVVSQLLEGAGVLHAAPQLVVMPNDMALGAFRREFGGILGWIEIRPTEPSDEAPGFADATRVVSSQKLLEHLASHPDEQVDARAYLKARLLDIFVGDWDRHAEQWRWARLGDKASDRWQPIPRDRDWAFVRLDGLVWSLVRFAYPYPQFVSFERRSPAMLWLTWNGRFLDRRFLASLDRPAWDSVTAALQQSLSDSLIETAARSEPLELYSKNGAELARTLRWRRDRLPSFAHEFYNLLADEVEIHATDASELVTLERIDARFTDVEIHGLKQAGAPRARPLFRRRFDANETREIRIYLGAGNDRVVIRGAASGATLVRLVEGGGTKSYVDSATALGDSRIRVYETNDSNGAVAAERLPVDRRPYTAPAARQWFAPAPDWGGRWRPLPWLGYTSDIGLFVGGGTLLERYGFRMDPYAYRMALRVGYATGVGKWRAEYDADFRRSNSGIHATIFARASTIDVVHYYGPGNESPAQQPARSFRVDQQQYALEPTLFWPLGRKGSIGIGPTVRRVVTERDTSLLTRGVSGYGTGSLSEVGARLQFTVDTRDRVEYATRGILVSTRGNFYPATWSVTRPYGSLQSQFSTYVTGPGFFAPTLALRVGGEKVWGAFPFFDAAFIGGASTVRGWNEQRFAGNASLYGNAELRVFLTKISLLLPSDLGIFGLADAGRVFSAGEQSTVLHRGFGGGVWLAPLGRSNTVSLAVARSREESAVYLRTGFQF